MFVFNNNSPLTTPIKQLTSINFLYRLYRCTNLLLDKGDGLRYPYCLYQIKVS